jgi:hypothetical protein
VFDEEDRMRSTNLIRVSLTALALAALLALVLALVLAPAVRTATAATTDRTLIAISTVNDFRVVVTATMGPDGQGAPPATITVAAYRATGGVWHRLGDSLRVGGRDSWFWKVVTGPHAIRNFSVSTDIPERFGLQIRITPSIGWSGLYRFHVQNGALVRN